MKVIDTLTNKVIAGIAEANRPKALVYVPKGDGMMNLVLIGDSGLAVHLRMGRPGTTAADDELQNRTAAFQRGC